MRKLLRKILPQALIDVYKQGKKRAAARQREELAKNSQAVSAVDIITTLQGQGIHEGDVLMVHSSLRKIGLVEKGADTLINSLVTTLGKEGTLMMPSFPAIGFNYDYLKTKPLFDVRHTPSRMGVVTETFRKRAGVLRSLHPTDPVIALGKEAAYLVKDHFGQMTPYNDNSPFYRLCALNGKILMIGVGLESLTNLHTLEDAVPDFKYPVYHDTLFTTELIDAAGNRQTMQTKVHNPMYSKKRRCNDLLPHFEAAGILKRFRLGLADCLLIDAQAMHAWMLENYNNRGITMYTPQGH